jgi:trk system potassium uptake protein TrkA
VKLKIARVRSQDYYSASSVFKPEDLGVDLFIHPEEEVTEEITRLLLRALASEVVEFAEGKILVLGIKIDKSFPFLNSQLKDVGTPEDRMRFRIVAIGRGDKTIIPSGEDYLNKDDQVFVATHAKDLQRLLTMTGRADQKLERIMVLGGGKIGLRLAGKLEKMGREVTVVESNKDKSVQAAERLRRSMVVEADAMEVDALAREGILNMDAVVAVTGDDEVNIISCLLAKHLGVRKTIALVNRTTYLPLLPVIGIDSSVNIRISTANAIMRLIRQGGIVSIGLFHGIEAEAIEAEVAIGSRLSGRELRKSKLPGGCLVAAVIRGENAFIPHGDSLIEEGDKIIMFALPSTIRELEGRFL